ncbi:MAG TPA: hypothetical protein VGE41_05505 [Verrucomicrobiae bacterium]|jgi:hypothetical protein
MSLKPVCESYVGKLLIVSPIYGWGWTRLDEGAPSLDYAQVLQAGSFAVRVHEFFHFKEMLRGAIGLVEQPNHIFDKLWISLCTMSVGIYDFEQHLCPRMDVQMAPQQPARASGWPEFSTSALLINGYAHIAESEELIDQFRAAQRHG